MSCYYHVWLYVMYVGCKNCIFSFDFFLGTKRGTRIHLNAKSSEQAGHTPKELQINSFISDHTIF